MSDISQAYKAASLATKNKNLKNLLNSYNGYENLSPKMKIIADNLIKEEETIAEKEERLAIWENEKTKEDGKDTGNNT